MIATPEKLSSAHKAAVDSALNTARTLFDSSERLAALNLNTARALLEDSSANVRLILSAKNPEELLSLQTGLVKPMAEKVLAYYRNCYEIFAQSIEDAVKPFEIQFAEINKVLASEMEKAAASAPIGSEAALAAVKTSIAAANSTYDQVSKASRQVVEIAEANLTAATEAAVKAVGSNTAVATRRKKTA